MPPAFVRIGIRDNKGDTFRIWFPLFLFLWPVLILLFVTTQALLLLAAAFVVAFYPRRAWMLLSLPVRILHLISLSRGTIIDVGGGLSLELV